MLKRAETLRAEIETKCDAISSIFGDSAPSPSGSRGRSKQGEGSAQSRPPDQRSLEQLRLKKEARRWEQRAEDVDEASRETKKQFRDEADKYLELIEQALKGTRTPEHLFTIRWRITA